MSTENYARFIQLYPSWALVRHGLRLHKASFLGPLRTSANYRANTPHWRRKVVQRFWSEYGANVLLVALAVLPLPIYLPLAQALILAPFALLLPPIFAVLQMFIDVSRGDSIIIADTELPVGATIRHSLYKERPLTRFHNHYGLPIGSRHGVPLREWLLSQAEENHGILACRAQSHEVGDYYKTAHPGAKEFHTHATRPTIVWNYSNTDVNADPTEEQKRHAALWRRLIGWDSMRDTGQALGF